MPVAMAAQLSADFQSVKDRAARVREELPRLDQALAAFAAHLKERADLAPDRKAAAIARTEEARAALVGHDLALRRFAAYCNAIADWTDAAGEIDRLAELLNAEGDRVLNVVADRTAREIGDPDRLAAAHSAYRMAMSELVDAARRMRDRMAAARERDRVASETSGGLADPRYRQLVAQFGEAFADAATYVPAYPLEIVRPLQRPSDKALDVALIWDPLEGEWHRASGDAPLETIFRDVWLAGGRRPTPGQLKILAGNHLLVGQRQATADAIVGYLAAAARDPAQAHNMGRYDEGGKMGLALAEPWIFTAKYVYDGQFRDAVLDRLNRIRLDLIQAGPAGAASLRALDELLGRFGVTLDSQWAEWAIPAVATVRVTAWFANNPKVKFNSTWRFDRERVKVELEQGYAQGVRKGETVVSEGSIPGRDCIARDTRTFDKGGALTFSAIYTCALDNGEVEVTDVVGAGVWEIASDQPAAVDRAKQATPEQTRPPPKRSR